MPPARFNIGHIKFRHQGITWKKYNKQKFVSAVLFFPKLAKQTPLLLKHYLFLSGCHSYVIHPMKPGHLDIMFVQMQYSLLTVLVDPKFRKDWATNLLT